MSKKLKYESAEDLRANYPDFFWKMVGPYIGDALRYLRVTQEGQQWMSNLYANVFSTAVVLSIVMGCARVVFLG
jgi:hypothetical protein